MNDFKILSKLGEGAYSKVYKVRRNIDNNNYALKKVKLLSLSEKEKLNALNEVRILASIKSPYVVSYKEAFFDETESCLCIVMEFAENGDLYQKISSLKKQCTYLEEAEIWRIFIHLVYGLKQLHDLTAVKPKNVKERTVQERRETLAYLMFLKRKSMAVDVPMVGNSGHIQTRTRRHRQPSLHRLYF